MTVLFLSQIVPFPPHGGVLQRGFNIVRELGRRCDVHLLAFVHPDALPSADTLAESRAALEPYCRTIEYFPLWVKRSRIALAAGLAASAASPLPFSVIAHRSRAFRRRVSHHLAARATDVLHVDTIALGQFFDPTANVPSALTHHNVESRLMERRASVETRWYARRYLQREASKLRAYEIRESPRFDVNIVMSDQDAITLADMAPGVRTAVVPNGVDTDYFQSDHGELETPALIYTGGMNMFANKDAVMYFLRDIWPEVVSHVPSTRFVVVGQDPPAELKDLASRDARIEVTGYVADIRPYVRQAAVYVVPLRVGGGTRLKVLDAMAMGKAVVATSVGCEGIDVTAGEQLIVADDPRSFAMETVALLLDPLRRRILSTSARRRVAERYSWGVIGDQLMDAYEMAAHAARPAR